MYNIYIIYNMYIYNYNIIMMFAHFFRPEDDFGAKILVLLGEANVLHVLHVTRCTHWTKPQVGGQDEYEVIAAVKSGRITKPSEA